MAFTTKLCTLCYHRFIRVITVITSNGCRGLLEIDTNDNIEKLKTKYTSIIVFTPKAPQIPNFKPEGIN
jgi:hypothetical protein